MTYKRPLKDFKLKLATKADALKEHNMAAGLSKKQISDRIYKRLKAFQRELHKAGVEAEYVRGTKQTSPLLLWAGTDHIFSIHYTTGYASNGEPEPFSSARLFISLAGRSETYGLTGSNGMFEQGMERIKNLSFFKGAPHANQNTTDAPSTQSSQAIVPQATTPDTSVYSNGLPEPAQAKVEKEPFRLELDRIVMFLNHRESGQSNKLWNVLTALRGPDSDDFFIKEATTAVIRRAVGLRTGPNSIIVNDDRDRHLKERLEKYPMNQQGNKLSSYGHFPNHAFKAFKALGLAWDKVNP